MNYYKISTILLIIAVVLLCFKSCSDKNRADNLLSEVTCYSDSVKTYKLKNEKLVSYNKVLEFDNKKQLADYLKKDSDYNELLKKANNVKVVAEIKEVITLKHDTIKLSDTIPCYFEPIAFEKINKYYSIYGTIGEFDLIIDTIQMLNTVKLVVSDKKKGWFQSEKMIEIINSNPYILNTNIAAYTIKDEKKWYETKLAAFGAGLLGGMIFNKIIK